MAASHFVGPCERIDPVQKARFQEFQKGKSAAGHGGKKYWADGARALGIVETEDRLCFRPRGTGGDDASGGGGGRGGGD